MVVDVIHATPIHPGVAVSAPLAVSDTGPER